jgi:hypothetical protein
MALLMAVSAAAAFALAVTTLPRSGPFCTGSCLAYPYSGTVVYVPGDYRWMYLAILLAPLFAVVMTCVHSTAAPEKRVFSEIALGFAWIAAALIAVDYFVQIEVMQPSLLKGETEGMALFSQYNPHGVFIALEDLGYLTMSAAFLFASPVFSRKKGAGRVLRWFFLATALLGYSTYVGMYLHFGVNLEYRFEVTIITINWMALVAVGGLLSIWFRRSGSGRAPEGTGD